ncbi:hypothetical protein LTR53_007866 [Teratosphaeriaceae sp. CCFEE 6253]|nr:hypothetical protein LTR53_007866 [Teratosphaeriaceae sp. CCFEE 6253]
MVPQPYPPTFPYTSLTARLSPSTAHSALADFLTLTETHPHLHPDAHLSTSGITFAAQSGPRGGLALHHLRRIEAGLRGERLGVEGAEELEREFGGIPEGDDAALDAAIAETAGKSGSGGERKGVLKRKRTSEWAETSSQPDSFLPPDSLQQAATSSGAEADVNNDGWEDKESYELAQRNAVGDVGDRGTHVVSQNGTPPPIKRAGGQLGGEEEKRAKRDTKRARKKQEQVERAEDRKARG